MPDGPSKDINIPGVSPPFTYPCTVVESETGPPPIQRVHRLRRLPSPPQVLVDGQDVIAESLLVPKLVVFSWAETLVQFVDKSGQLTSTYIL
jgi:hypothetical protein